MIRGQVQLQELSFRFCKSSGSSSGFRAVLLGPELSGFAAQFPGVGVRVREAPMRAPSVTARWRDGSSKVIGLKNGTSRDVVGVIARLRDAASGARRSFKKPVTAASGSVSVQGVWDPSITYNGFSVRVARQLPVQAPPAALQ